MHSDQAVIFYRAAVNHGVVADRDVLANGEGIASVDVTGDIVLDVGAFPNDDGLIVSTQHRIEPDADVGVKCDVSDNFGSRCEVATGINFGSAIGGNRENVGFWCAHSS